MPAPTIHASCVSIRGRAVLLRGPSGSGKSDLALRLIDGGAVLVADDRVVLEVQDGLLMASPPERLAGMMEARGIGILENLPWQAAPLALVVDLVPSAAIERAPEPATCDISGIRMPRIELAPFEASATAKLRRFLASLEETRLTRDSAAQ